MRALCVLSFVLLAVYAAGAHANCPGVAKYDVIVRSRWTAVNFPHEFPASGAEPRYNGFVGSLHKMNESLAVYAAPGTYATNGVKKSVVYDDHVDLYARDLHHGVDADYNGQPLSPYWPRDEREPDRVTTIVPRAGTPVVYQMQDSSAIFHFHAQGYYNYTHFSVISGIQPSPDWFVGAFGVQLCNAGMWVNAVDVESPAYDAGFYDGTTYETRGTAETTQMPVTASTAAPFTTSLPGNDTLVIFQFRLAGLSDKDAAEAHGVPELRITKQAGQVAAIGVVITVGMLFITVVLLRIRTNQVKDAKTDEEMENMLK